MCSLFNSHQFLARNYDFSSSEAEEVEIEPTVFITSSASAASGGHSDEGAESGKEQETSVRFIITS